MQYILNIFTILDLILKIILILTLLPGISLAHRGGQIKSGPLKGCHHDRKRGNFHCHTKSTLSGRSFKTKSEALKALGHSSNSSYRPYNRKSWGGWKKDGCIDMRAKILIKTSKSPVEMSKSGCTVKSGLWESFYFPEKFTLASQIQIDHVVPVAEAHRSGGAQWNSEQKAKFYNDPENLVISCSKHNGQKSDKTIAEWSPIHREYNCKWVKKYIQIKKKYNLKISTQELNAEKIANCK